MHPRARKPAEMFFSRRGACGGIFAEQVARGDDLTTHFPFAARGNKRCLAASKGEQVTVNVGTGASLITKVKHELRAFAGSERAGNISSSSLIESLKLAD